MRAFDTEKPITYNLPSVLTFYATQTDLNPPKQKLCFDAALPSHHTQARPVRSVAVSEAAQVLEHARRAGEQPWRGLADLGRRVGIPELTELADIAEDAGSEGTQVLSTLLAKAQSMRTTALTDARARANSRTSEMPIAIGISIFGFLVLVCFPAVYRIMS